MAKPITAVFINAKVADCSIEFPEENTLEIDSSIPNAEPLVIDHSSSPITAIDVHSISNMPICDSDQGLVNQQVELSISTLLTSVVDVQRQSRIRDFHFSYDEPNTNKDIKFLCYWLSKLAYECINSSLGTVVLQALSLENNADIKSNVISSFFGSMLVNFAYLLIYGFNQSFFDRMNESNFRYSFSFGLDLSLSLSAAVTGSLMRYGDDGERLKLITSTQATGFIITNTIMVLFSYLSDLYCPQSSDTDSDDSSLDL